MLLRCLCVLLLSSFYHPLVVCCTSIAIIGDQRKVFNHAIMSARSWAFFMPTKFIFVPFTAFLGLAMNEFSLSSPHIPPKFFMAVEYLNPCTVATLRPVICHRFGPTRFAPLGVKVWHALHFLAIFFPCSMFALASRDSIGSMVSASIVCEDEFSSCMSTRFSFTSSVCELCFVP